MPAQDEARVDTQWFHASGRFTGLLAELMALLVIVFGLIEGTPVAVVLGAVLFGLLAYVAMLRPRIGIRGQRLVLRDMIATQELPLASIDSARVGRYFRASVDGKDYTSSAITRSLRQAMRRRPGQSLAETGGNYVDLVEEQVQSSIEIAQASGWERGPVTRTWAWTEIGLIAAVAIAFVVTLLV